MLSKCVYVRVSPKFSLNFILLNIEFKLTEKIKLKDNYALAIIQQLAQKLYICSTGSTLWIDKPLGFNLNHEM